MTSINIRYWLCLAAGQRQQYRNANAKGREELREIWEGQLAANLAAVERMTGEAWAAAEIDTTQRKADHWAALLQWAEDLDKERQQMGLALEVMA